MNEESGPASLLKKSIVKRTQFAADDGANADLVSIKPALLHFQHVTDVVGARFNRRFVQRLQIVDFQDRALAVDVSAGQWKQGVLHPKGTAMGAGKAIIQAK